MISHREHQGVLTQGHELGVKVSTPHRLSAQGRTHLKVIRRSARVYRDTLHPYHFINITLHRLMTANGTATPGQKATVPPHKTWFEIPAPLRRIFDKFPLTTYSSNRLPQRAPTEQDSHILYVFKDPNYDDELSCNPSCLKWQAFLRFRKINLRLRSSNNHASPSGALPFLLPAQDDGRPKSPVSASKLPRWVVAQGGKEEGHHIQEEAYMALIDHSIRNAWLHYLYIDRDNFNAVAWSLYVQTASRSMAVQQATAYQLKAAAMDELSKTMDPIDGNALYKLADDAFQALSTLLGDKEQFFDNAQPGLFDASLFAYTHLLLDSERNWTNEVLVQMLKKYENLVQHRETILENYFDG